MLKVAGAVMASLLIAKSCTIGTGNPQDTGGGSANLRVPYIAQVGALTCGPAAVQMWAWYNGNTSVTQQQIANYIGCSPNAGSSIGGITSGVQHFANVGDAYADYPGGVGDPDTVRGEFDARQITSVNNRVPLIALINGGLHAGVVDGGSWHQSGSLNVWDFVNFHDPEIGPDQQFVAGDWDSTVLTQVISASASAGASSNFSTYGPNTIRRGAGGAGGHGPLPV
jgi:hypothetical protein